MCCHQKEDKTTKNTCSAPTIKNSNSHGLKIEDPPPSPPDPKDIYIFLSYCTSGVHYRSILLRRYKHHAGNILNKFNVVL